MAQTKQHCGTPEQLLAFLRGQLSAHEEADLQHHLDDCVLCRERLESTAADASVWNEAKEFFGNGALQAATRGFSADHDDSDQGQYRIRQVLDSLGPTDDPESLGRIGGYEVTGVVGAGGMGVVLKAHDRSLDRIVAIKVMAPHLASSGSARKRFAREAKAAAAVLHPNVIAIHSVASEDADPYLIMPFVRGASLQKRIDSQGPLPLKDTLRIGAQIAAGLAAAHEQGLVHRDIKPANILLEEGVERVTITDFGLARAVDDASMTCSGVIAGTPQYMSPEQARGEPIDARSDLFSLGGVLYAMCTGRSPFRAETTYGVLHRIANDKPTPVCEVNTDVPLWLGQVIERLMAKRPEDRFESAAQVAELLEGCLAHVQQPAAMPLPAAVDALAPKKTRLPPISKFIAAAAFVFAFIFAGVFVVLELNKGTLTIQSDVDGIQVRITRGEEIVEDLKVTKGEKSIRVAAGQYAVEMTGDADGLTVENGQVTLHRADTEVVKITRNTHDDNLRTYTDPNAALQAYRSNSSDSLSETIDQFNFLRTKDPLNDQPPLTKDELIACASWNIERNHELTESLKATLNKIAKQHQWPEGWWIDGSFPILPPQEKPVRVYRISLVSSTTGERFTIRERFIEPSPEYRKPNLQFNPLDGMQLASAIKRFNASYNQANGHKQPPLTENEVVAAIFHHKTKRDEADVSDALFDKFQKIATTRCLPEGASLEVIPTFGVEGGSTYTIWSVRIKMLQDEAGKEGWTYAFVIRDQFVSLKHGDAGEIHWGRPSESGLQAGVRLSPPLLSYELGQKIDVQILYRNILNKPIAATVPNFCGYEVEVHDASGARMEVFDLEEPIVVGGAISRQIGNEPISSHGRSLAFAATSLAKDKREEYRAKTGASILIFVEPGKPYRLQFTVSSLADSAAERLKTGEVEIAVEKANEDRITDNSVTTDGPAKIIVDVYGGNRVLGQNNSKYAKLVQALNAINEVQVNFREAGQGSEIVLAIVRDQQGLMGQEDNSTGKPSVRREAIVKALAQVPTVRWEEGLQGVSLQSNQTPAEKLAQDAKERVAGEADPRFSKPRDVVFSIGSQRFKLDMNTGESIPQGATESNAPAIDHQNARSVVEAYVALALAGEIARAASLAKNSPADPKRIRELPGFFKIETVYIDDPARPTRALATSAAVKLDEEHKNRDGRQIGFLVFTLEFTDDKWLVFDIDFESESGAEQERNKFLKANSNSIGIPPQSQSLFR